MNIEFIGGKAIIKKGRNKAKVYDRKAFFKNTNYENSFNQFPYSVEMHGGLFECENLEKVKNILNIYL